MWKPVLNAEEGAVVSVKNLKETFPKNTCGGLLMENQECFKISVISSPNSGI